MIPESWIKIMLLPQKISIYSLLLFSSTCFSAGMIPDTSLLLINQDENGGNMDVKNSDGEPQLLYTKIIDLPEDPKPGLIVTQPVVRVDAGKKQRVRFVLQNSTEPLKVEHLKRVVFTTIPQRPKNKVKVIFSQNLPVIIHPSGLEENIEPWKGLQWSMSGGSLSVENKTAYVVRLEQQVSLKPSGNVMKLPKTYILPGEKLMASGVNTLSVGDKQVEIYPATRYGYQEKNFIASIN